MLKKFFIEKTCCTSFRQMKSQIIKWKLSRISLKEIIISHIFQNSSTIILSHQMHKSKQTIFNNSQHVCMPLFSTKLSIMHWLDFLLIWNKAHIYVRAFLFALGKCFPVFPRKSLMNKNGSHVFFIKNKRNFFRKQFSRSNSWFI